MKGTVNDTFSSPKKNGTQVVAETMMKNVTHLYFPIITASTYFHGRFFQQCNVPGQMTCHIQICYNGMPHINILYMDDRISYHKYNHIEIFQI